MSEITSPVATGVTDVEVRIARRKMDVMLFKQAMEETDGKLNPEYVARLKQPIDWKMSTASYPGFHGGVQTTL